MSEKPVRVRVPVNRRIRPPHGPPSTHRLGRRVVVRRSSKKPLELIKRCKSEPALLTVDLSVDVDGATDDHGGMISQSRACADVFSSSQELLFSQSPPKVEAYNKDAKVVVNVTVDGSPGPIRAMVKLGSTVEETMKVIEKMYNSEGRSPHLDQHAISTFELHPLYFSLQCLDKSDMIGDIGSRSFYMRRCNKGNGDMRSSNSFTGSEIISTRANTSPPSSPIIHFPNFISHKFKKIIRMSSKLWKILGCIDG